MIKRIDEIDALRGIALFGILLVNIFIFHAPYSYYNDFYGAFVDVQASIIELVIRYASGKFLFIFAFLFGFGIQLQHKSLMSRFTNYHICRMLLLMAIGAIHILAFWFGDILLSYGLLGLVMLLFLRLPTRLFPLFGITVLFFSPIYYIGCVVLEWPMVAMEKPLEMSSFLFVFQEGSFFEILPVRLKEFNSFIPENVIWFIPKTLGLFLLGYWSAQKKLTSYIKKRKQKFAGFVLILLISFSVWSTNKAGFFNSFDLSSEPIYRPLLIAINIFFDSLLSLAYIIGFLLLFQQFKKLSVVFERAGRMALSNYILQSLICVSVFYGYGLGYYGKLKPSNLVLLVILIYSINLIFSWFYLKFYQQGPLETLWRKSAKRLQSMNIR